MNEHSHLSRLLGLLFAVAVLALTSRWLQSDLEASPPASAGGAVSNAMAGASTVGMADPWAAQDPPVQAATRAPAHAPAGERHAARLGPAGPPEPVALHSARPVSAALCHALVERMRALDDQAAENPPRHELRKLRAERQRARELLHGLRCRAGSDSYWF